MHAQKTQLKAICRLH